MIAVPFEFAMEDNNPLEMIAEDLENRKWLVMRDGDDVLDFEARGKHGHSYNGCFEWQEEFSALLLSIAVKTPVNATFMTHAREVLQQMNDNLWLGHFDLTTDGIYPTFRYTFMLRGIPPHAAAEMAFDVVDIAVAECDRFHDTFAMLSRGDVNTQNSLAAAVLETVGEA